MPPRQPTAATRASTCMGLGSGNSLLQAIRGHQEIINSIKILAAMKPPSTALAPGERGHGKHHSPWCHPTSPDTRRWKGVGIIPAGNGQGAWAPCFCPRGSVTGSKTGRMGMCVCACASASVCLCVSHCVRRWHCRLRGARRMGAARGGVAVGAQVGVQAGCVRGLIAL